MNTVSAATACKRCFFFRFIIQQRHHIRFLLFAACRDYRMDRFLGGALQSDIRSPSNGFTSGRGSRVLFVESHSVGPVLIVDSDRLRYRTRR